MPKLTIIPLDPLRRPAVPGREGIAFGEAIELVACRNEVVSGLAQIRCEGRLETVRARFSGPVEGTVRLASAVPVAEADGLVCDPLLPAETFAVEGSLSLWLGISVPKDLAAGVHEGTLEVIAGDESAALPVKLVVVDFTLADPSEWSFFLNLWMNPAPVADWHGVPLWSEEHWALLEPYIADLASHGQKTVVAPIAHRPWGDQTPLPYPNLIAWTRDDAGYHFDYTRFDRYVELHEKLGISRAIHCYSPVQGPGHGKESQIAWVEESGQEQVITTVVGDDDYREAWGSFFRDFESHLRGRNWLEKTYVGFDEKPTSVMEVAFSFLREVAPELKIALAANEEQKLYAELDDISLAARFNVELGIIDGVSGERLGTGKLTTYYVCCGPMYPNTFTHSPLVESRMLAWLAWQGGFAGFLRWAYNDWTSEPFEHPEWRLGFWPTGDCYFVYPGDKGPISSLRWEQLREGIQDFELLKAFSRRIGAMPAGEAERARAILAEAVALACRNVDGSQKDPEDLRRAREMVLRGG